MEKISIIMGAYNAENTICRAIESILAQSYENWILLICDDGSTDNTYGICNDYAQKYENIRVYKNEDNKGLTYTLNKLIAEVHTEYIARMDADDICRVDRLQKQVDFLESNEGGNYAFVSSAINRFDENGIYDVWICKEKPEEKDLLWNNPFAHPCILIRTKVLKLVDGYRDIKKTVRCEDYDLWFRLYAKGYRGYNIQEPLLDYYDGKETWVKKRQFRYRVNEARVRLEGYKNLRLMPKGILYVLKPIVIGLLPISILKHIKTKF